MLFNNNGTTLYVMGITGDDVDAYTIPLTQSSIYATDTTARFGVGTNSPQDMLHVAGDVRVGTGTTGCVKDADGTVIAGTCSSDLTLKTDILALALATTTASSTRSVLDAVVALEPVTYRWNSTAADAFSYGTTEIQTGLIAQQVQETLPELVTTSADGYLQVRFSELPIYTIQALKELDMKVDEIEARIGTEATSAGEGGERSEPPYLVRVLLGWFESVGVFVSESVARFNNLAAATLAIGTSDAPSGITLYDTATGEPYCVVVEHGSVVHTTGACAVNDESAATHTDAPTIALVGNALAEVALNSQYADLGATAQGIRADGLRVDINHTLFLNGQATTTIALDTATSSVYYIDYLAVYNEQFATTTRTVLVGDAALPAQRPESTLVDWERVRAEHSTGTRDAANSERGAENSATTTPATTNNAGSSPGGATSTTATTTNSTAVPTTTHSTTTPATTSTTTTPTATTTHAVHSAQGSVNSTAASTTTTPLATSTVPTASATTTSATTTMQQH